jgi:hypothetical protein
MVNAMNRNTEYARSNDLDEVAGAAISGHMQIQPAEHLNGNAC